MYHRSCFTAYHRLYLVSASTEVVRWLNYLLNKCVISLLGPIFVSHLVSADVGTLQLVVSRVTLWLLLKKVVPITCLYRHVWFFFDLISTKLLICFSTKWNGERKEQGGSNTQRGREVVAQGPRWLWYNFWTGFSVSLSSMLLNFLGPSSLCIEFCYVYLHLNQASLLAVFYLSYIMFAGVISLMDICTMFMPFELDSLWLNSLCYNYGQIWEELTHVKLILVRFLGWKSNTSICSMRMHSELGSLSLRGCLGLRHYDVAGSGSKKNWIVLRS